ncbi:hypothetical protein AT4G09589 [Arabidopsis thaliana]|uniref:Uncharacterized protein n=1 Tax=Arabidopsis thaliana TaxID=3702 RepID=A0A1P8B398_ARATH|nr:uncharacterized protein AT4G09589 [Arabidopsis thaliana]ANM66073.1 hypothetical protein AT4G09589 [Arabidopsis thaliana]|eukprot:NP_001327995.1 hypothetical protein AT4G09589 [Arabidopsis thaliana]
MNSGFFGWRIIQTRKIVIKTMMMKPMIAPQILQAVPPPPPPPPWFPHSLVVIGIMKRIYSNTLPLCFVV